MSVVPVVFCFDSRIILGASVAIKSLIDSANESTVYDIRIFHSDLSLKNQKNISSLVENTRHNIAFHYINPEIFKNAPKSRGSWTEIVYYRLLVPEILKEYDKAIYSDVDVLFKGDLSELYNTNIEGYEAAAIPSYRTEYLKQINSKRYFPENKNSKNYMSGLILFNNKLVRIEKLTDRFLETIETFRSRLVYYDMDVFNLACDKIIDLPLNYCVFESLYEYTDIEKIKEYKALNDLYSKQELLNIKQNPVIIHYAGQLGKPWQRKWIPDYYQEYIDKLPKSLVKYTFRDYRKKYLSTIKYPIQHFDVGLVNFYHTQNYGACLTAYALQEIIKNLGFSCAYLNEFKLKNKYKFEYSNLFANHYLNKMPRYNNLKKAGETADTYITGSDQVLRPDYLKKESSRQKYLLKFVHKNAKKIAFSSSFGIGEQEFSNSNKNIVREIKKELSKFDYVSTRELSGVDICKNYLNIYAEQIMDPVFLLNKELFINLAKKSKRYFSNSIVSYILDSDSDWESYIKKLSKKYNLPVTNIGLKHSKLSVEDWLKAFLEAKYIITDSYHGACFALIFNKPFIVKLNKKRGIARFETLMEIFNLNKQFLDIPNEDGFILYDTNRINSIIEEKQKQSISILNRILNTNSQKFITNNCTGCGACSNICKQNAIKMKENHEGFKYPEIDRTLCVNCGKCKSICPTANIKKNNNYIKPKCYAIMANDEIRLNRSSSGGVFTVLAQHIISQGGYVAGAGFNGMEVQHYVVSDLQNLDKLKGSKYLQSNTNDCYKQIKTLLTDNKTVLFTGTPCQVAGLKSYLQQDYKNLITVDIVCHGVPSPKIFRKYINEKLKPDEKFIEMNFRNKIKGWSPELNTTTTTTTTTTYNEPASKNEYMQMFLKNFILRKSCYMCPFQKIPRQGDLTIGDFWKIQKFDKNMDDKLGTSLLLVNNNHGHETIKNITNSLKMFVEVPIKYAIKGNKTLVKSTNYNKQRDEVLLKANECNLKVLAEQYIKRGK